MQQHVANVITWGVTTQFTADSVTGQADIGFTFDEFNMKMPSVFIVVSVEDDIKLELDFAASISR